MDVTQSGMEIALISVSVRKTPVPICPTVLSPNVAGRITSCGSWHCI